MKKTINWFLVVYGINGWKCIGKTEWKELKVVYFLAKSGIICIISCSSSFKKSVILFKTDLKMLLPKI